MSYRIPSALVAAALFASVASALAQQPARLTSVDGRVEVSDRTGDIQPIVYLEGSTSGPEKEVKYPGFDIVKLVVSSDGKAITFAATLTAPPARAAHEVVEFHIDADNNPKTGITYPEANALSGLEYYGTLDVCLEHTTFGTTCAGTDPKPAGHTAVVTLEKYGRDWMFKDTLFDIPAAGAVKEPRKAPIAGPVVQATVDYSAMRLKPGQTIRIVAREHSAGKVQNVAQGFFPEILLTLK